MMEPSLESSGKTDFDFLHGTWNMTSRRLPRWFAGSDRWEKFPATVVCRSLLGGSANVDEIIFPGKEFTGMSVRMFNPRHVHWLELNRQSIQHV